MRCGPRHVDDLEVRSHDLPYGGAKAASRDPKLLTRSELEN